MKISSLQKKYSPLEHKKEMLLSKKQLLAFFAAVFSLLIISASLFTGIALNAKWNALIVGIILTIISVIIYFACKGTKLRYVYSYILNNLGIGLSISAFYTVKQVNLNALHYLFGICIFILLFVALWTITIKLKGKAKQVVKIIVLTTLIVIIIFLFIMWLINLTNPYYSIGFFMLFNASFYIALFFNVTHTDNIFKKISGYCYGIYFLITMLVVIILSECNADFSFDIPIGGGNKKNKK